MIGIIKSHGGFVDVYSEVGMGTEFKVYLPAADTGEIDSVAPVEFYQGHGELILVADDESAICEILKTALETYNYRVITASDGVEALALYSQHKDEIKVVLTDILMSIIRIYQLKCLNLCSNNQQIYGRLINYL